jgi:CheY-like chemotaxis protein
MQSATIPVVLCVDDDELLLDLLQEVLAGHGFHSLTTTNGREALRLLEQNPVDAVILDYSMPDMNGEAVAVGVRTVTPHIPIILFSGSLDIPPSTLQLTDAFVAKGANLSALLTVLGRLLQSCTEHKPVRKFPRFAARLELAVTVDRTGQLAMLQGIATDLGEGGMGGTVDGDLEPGEYVLLSISDSRLETPLEPRAQVRYRKSGVYGFAFLDVNAPQQAKLRHLCGLLGAA